MNRSILALASGSILLVLGACSSSQSSSSAESTTASNATTPANSVTFVTNKQTGAAPLKLGNFSVSLAVKDLAASKAFYEKLGFQVKGGNGKNWVILQNETSTIGLFQGMFDKNTLTFNPGWDRSSNALPEFADVREIQRDLKSKGLKLINEADETTSGPAFIMLLDPDGNPILVDQHVPGPKK